jgi:hypothetical protein
MAVIRPYLALGLTLLLLTSAWYYGHTRYAAGELAGNTRVAQLTAQHAQQLQYLAELSTRASEAAREAEQKQAAGFAALAAGYEKDKTDAKHKGDAVAAALRADTLRLRQQWTCPSAAAGAHVPEAAAATGQPDGDAELRATGAGDLVRLAAQCDAQVRGLQQAQMAR